MRLIYIITIVCALIFNVSLVIYTAVRRNNYRSLYLTFLFSVVVVYYLGQILEGTSVTTDAVIVAMKVKNVGISFLAPLYFLVAISIAHEEKIRPWMYMFTAVYGFYMAMTIIFNDYHHLYFTYVSSIPGELMVNIIFGKGPLYIVNKIIIAIITAAGVVILIPDYIRGNKKFKYQIACVIAAGIVVLGTHVYDMLGFNQYVIEATQVGILLGDILIAVSLIRFGLFDTISLSSTLAVEHMNDSMVILDNDSNFLYCNKATYDIFPDIRQLKYMDDITKFSEWPEDLVGLENKYQISFERRNGKSYRANVCPIYQKNNKKVGWSIVIRDVTNITELMNKFEEMANIDALTGILNRRKFMNMARSEYERADEEKARIQLVLIDIDLFKTVNDTYGHDCGDYVLFTIASILKRALRPYDIFARYGGEEFIVLTSSAHPIDLFVFAERLRISIESYEFQYEGKFFHLTSSFGGIQFQTGDMSLENAIKKADELLYEAKRSGRNRVIVRNIL